MTKKESTTEMTKVKKFVFKKYLQLESVDQTTLLFT